MTRSSSLVLRVMFGLVAAGVLVWAALVMQTLNRGLELRRYAFAAGNGLPLPAMPANLADRLDAIAHSASCGADQKRQLALIRIREAEGLFVGDGIAEARDALLAALHCNPADALLWLFLFRLDATIEGLSERHFDMLRRSYATGRNEGWIAVRRNPNVMALGAGLPDDLQHAALTEYRRLIESGFYAEAAASTLASTPYWRPYQVAVLDQLQDGVRDVFRQYIENAGGNPTIFGLAKP